LDVLIIEGGAPLSGEVMISGAKNAALPIMAAAMLVEEGETVLINVPDIDDVSLMMELMQQFGVKVWRTNSGEMHIDASGLQAATLSYEQTKKIRASNLLLGPLLARMNEAFIPLPGGCDIGSRPIDLHIKGIERLGAVCSLEQGMVHAKAKHLQGNDVYLDFPSVGATENIMIVAALTEGTTTIENVAKEPEIVDLASFLGTLGVLVRGAGTDVIRIEGVQRIAGSKEHTIIPDRIEAGTFMVAGACCGGELLINNVIPKHLEAMSVKLAEIGAYVEVRDDSVFVKSKSVYHGADIKTFPYPGFPTDMQSQFMALLTKAGSDSVITENIFENRLRLANELIRMGADIKVENRMAVVSGGRKLSGAPVRATDLRAGAALIIAGLMAEGTTEITGVEFIDRGYEKIERKLRSVGANIYRGKRTGVDIVDKGYNLVQEKIHRVASGFGKQ